MKKTLFVIVLVAVLVLCGVSAYAIQGLDESKSTRVLANDGYATLTTDQVGGSVTTTKEILLGDGSASVNGLHVTDTYSVFSMDGAFVRGLTENMSGSAVTFSIGYNKDKTAVNFTITDDGTEIFSGKGRCVGELPYTLPEGKDSNNVTMTTLNGAPVGISGYYPDASLVRWQVFGNDTYTVKVNDIAFSDVTDEHWANIYVEYLASKGVINGMGDGSFAPEGPLTRAQFVTLLAMMSQDVLGEGKDYFTDVPAGTWYYEEVAWAAEAGITNGMGDGSFAPENKITRQEVACMVLNFYNYMGIAATPIRSDVEFSDSNLFASWAADEIGICQSIGVISGFPDGTFHPTGNTTRAEAATMCSRMVSHALILPQ